MTNSSCGGAELELCRDDLAAFFLKFVAILLIKKHLCTDGNLFVATKVFALGVILATEALQPKSFKKGQLATLDIRPFQ